MPLQELLMKLIQSQRLMLDGMTMFMTDKPEGRPQGDEDIFGQKLTPLQKFIAEASVGVKTFGDNG